MAVINCPGCKKKISDKAKVCSHCNLALQELDEDKMATLNKIKKIHQAQRLMTFSFIAMLLFCGGFLFMYKMPSESWEHTLATVSTVVGFIMYIVVRIMLVFNKRKSN